MFELVEQQPSHLACQDVLNLSLGECCGYRVKSDWDNLLVRVVCA